MGPWGTTWMLWSEAWSNLILILSDMNPLLYYLSQAALLFSNVVSSEAKMGRLESLTHPASDYSLPKPSWRKYFPVCWN